MDSIRKGDIFQVNFDPTVGSEVQKTRPGVIVSNNINNAHSPIVSISPITSNIKKVYSFEVLIPMDATGLTKPSKIMVNQTRAVDKIRLIQRLGILSDEIINQLDHALKLHYDLS